MKRAGSNRRAVAIFAAAMATVLLAGQPVGLIVLPLIGVALNGTSSVLYGTVPELVAPELAVGGDVGEAGAGDLGAH